MLDLIRAYDGALIVFAFTQAIYMTPELRHGLYAVDPKDLGGDKYEAEREQDRENEKARWGYIVVLLGLG